MQEPGSDEPETEPDFFRLGYIFFPFTQLLSNFNGLTNSMFKASQLADTVGSCYTDLSFFNWL